jgi:hypothetical protein
MKRIVKLTSILLCLVMVATVFSMPVTASGVEGVTITDDFGTGDSPIAASGSDDFGVGTGPVIASASDDFGEGTPPDGMVSYWRMDEGTGEIVEDTSNGNDGIMVPSSITPTWTNGQIDDALYFDGVNDYVDFGDASSFSFGDGTDDNPFTLSAWIKTTGSPASFAGIISKDLDYPNREYTLGMLPSGKLRIFIKDQGGNNQQSIDSTNSVTDDFWHFVVATYDGRGGSNAADGLNLYIDGALETPTNVIKQTYTAMKDTGAPLRIGKYANSPNLHFKGDIDEFTLWDKSLTLGEIQNLYSDGQGGTEIIPGVNTLGIWHLNEGTGSFTVDSTTNNNHGSLEPGNSPAWADGKVGSGLRFDGIDDYVIIGAKDDLRPGTGDFSGAAWIKSYPAAGWHSIISDRAAGNPKEGYNFYLYQGKLWILLEDSTFVRKQYCSVNSYDDNQWYHVAFTWDASTETLKLFVDGSELTPNIISDASIGDVSPSTSVSIGSQIGGYNTFFNGFIDEVAIWDQALSADEILQDYNSGLVGKGYNYITASDDFEDGDLVGWTAVTGTWSVVDEGGNKVVDQSGIGSGVSSPVLVNDVISDAPSKFTLSASVRLASGNNAGLLFNYQDQSNFYFVSMSEKTGHSLTYWLMEVSSLEGLMLTFTVVKLAS